MDEDFWVAYRKRARRRANSYGALILSPVVIAVAVLLALSLTDHPAGDIRDTVAFRVVVYGSFIVFAMALVVGSIRWLQADRRQG